MRVAKWTFLGALILYCGLFLANFPRGFESGDNAYKIQQLKDFHSSGTIEALYEFRAHDPQYRFFPAIYPFIIEANATHYLPYPFQLIFFYYPFWLIGGLPGIFFLVFLCGIGILFITYLVVLEQERPESASVVLVSVALGSALIPYAFSAYEHVPTAFACTAAAYFFLFRRGAYNHIIAGIIAGLGTFIRAEMILIVPLLLAGRFLSSRKWRWKQDLSFAMTAMVIFCALLLSNLLLTGHAFGFRGKAGFSWINVSEGLFRILEYLVLREHAYTTVLKATPAVAMSLLTLFLWRKADDRFLAILAAGWGYCLAIPFLISMPPAAQFGERYIMAAYPLLILALLPLTQVSITWQRRAFLGLILTATVWTATGAFAHLQNAHKFRNGLKQIGDLAWQASADENVIVLRNRTLNTFYFNDSRPRMYLLAESDQDFVDLIETLQKANVHSISIWHTLLRGDNLISPQGDRFTFAKTIVPPDFKGRLKARSTDVPFLEIANYEIE